VTNQQPRRGEAHLIAAQPHAVARIEPPAARPATATARAAPITTPARVVDVGLILGEMDVDDRAELARQRAGLARRLVGNREARVQPDEAAHQRRGGEATTLRQSSPRLFAAEIALARAVADERARAEFLAGFGEDRQRSFDPIRRFVMVDERRRPGEQRTGDVVARRSAETVGVKRAVERHHTFCRFEKVGRRRLRRRHA